MPVKRKRGNVSHGPIRKKYKLPSVQQAVKAALQRTVETKQTFQTSNDGTEIGHNNFIVMDTNILETTQGVADAINGTTNNRIGDEIALKGVKLKFMVELNERYSDVTFRMFVVKKTITKNVSLFCTLRPLS
jgi:hypothetical protein